MVYKGIAGNLVSKLTGSLGIDSGIAGTLSSVALPMIMNKIGGATQAAGDTDGIDAGSMMSALGIDSGSLLSGLAGGGAAGDLLGKAAGMLGDAGEKGKDAGGGLNKTAASFLWSGAVFGCQQLSVISFRLRQRINLFTNFYSVISPIPALTKPMLL